MRHTCQMIFSTGVLSCNITVNANQGEDVVIVNECVLSVCINDSLYHPDNGFPNNYSYNLSTLTLLLAATCEQDGDTVECEVCGQTGQTTCVHVAGL